MKHSTIVIIGAGLASYQFAREFRKLDQTTALQIITADAGVFYSKPQLSNAFAAKRTPQTLINADAATMAAQLNITVTTHTSVTKIDTLNKIIYSGEQQFPYTKLILACGAEVIKPPMSGSAATDILSINHLHDYARFREKISEKKHIAILGAGLIGCEFANDLINAGFTVDVIAPAKAPLDLLVPEPIGLLLQNALAEKGVRFHFNCIAEQVDHQSNQISLQLTNGNILTVDCVLSAIGLKPCTTLAKAANIHTNRGILVNAFLETNITDIYALGDCAEVEGQVLPFITPLLQCARTLAQTIAGTRTAVNYPAMPVTVKTPACPIIVCLPPKNIDGTWKIETENSNGRALYYDNAKKLRGFILANQWVSERAKYLKEIM